MNITVSVDSLTLDTVVNQVFGTDEDGDRYEIGGQTIADVIAGQILAKLTKDDRWPRLNDTVMEVRKEEIRDAVRPSIDEALARPITKTNGYGDKVGAETTLAEIIADEARKQLTEPADRYRNEKGTLLQQAVRAEVDRAFKAEIADAVKAARDAVTEQIGAMVGEQVAAAVRAGITSR
ncbi:hypothetical protein [Streptacidiphilus sp. PAMC 29251]